MNIDADKAPTPGEYKIVTQPEPTIVDIGPKPMPAMIAIAISKVQGEIAAVEAKEKNEFANFKFAGVNIIYAMVIKKMAEAGLVIIPLEIKPLDRFEKQTPKGIKTFGKFFIGFQLVAHDGKGKSESWFHPMNCVTIITEITGAVTAQAVMSFAQKTYLRGLFKMPVAGEGQELELDGLEHESHEDKPKEPVKKAGRRKSKAEPFEAPLSEAARKKLIAELLKTYQSAAGPLSDEVVGAWSSKNAQEIARLREADRLLCISATKGVRETPSQSGINKLRVMAGVTHG